MALFAFVRSIIRSAKGSRHATPDVWLVTNSHLFDEKFYSRQVAIEFRSTVEAARHFLRIGAASGRDPHPLFSSQWYASRQPSLEADVNPLVHYLQHGASTMRQPHPLFNPQWYLGAHPEYEDAKADPLGHYIRVGWRVRCKPHPLFDPDWYYERYPDVAAAAIDGFRHFVEYGAAERRSPCESFDTAWYTDQYPDVEAAGHNALSHFITDGVLEGRNPSAHFDTKWYLQKYPDVAAARLNPFLHYVEHGRREGRAPAPEKEVELRSDFGIDRQDFVGWRNNLDAARHWKRPGASAIGADQGSAPRPPQLIVAVSSTSTDGYPPVLVPVQKMAKCVGDSIGIDMEVRLAQSLLGGYVKDIPSSCVIVFVEEHDLFDEKGLSVLHAEAEHSRLCIFDMFFCKESIVYPVLHPGFNRLYLRSTDGVFSRFAIKGDLFKALIKLHRPSTIRDTFLRALDTLEGDRDFESMAHCAFPVLETPDLSEKIAMGRRTAIARRISQVDASTCPFKISIVICTKDNGHLLDQLLRRIFFDCSDLITDVTIVSNNTTNEFALQTLDEWSQHDKVLIVEYRQDFNFSEQCNIGATKGDGSLILFMNDDIVPVASDWLVQLAQPFRDPSVGVVGPLLLYPDETVQHAGMYLGLHGIAGHTLRAAKLPDDDYVFMGLTPRDVSAVTGAVMLIRRSCFEDLNGFDTQLKTYLQDVDICLRVIKTGLRVIYTPDSVLLHMESVSITPTLQRVGIQAQRAREHNFFCRRHGRMGQRSDRYLNISHHVADEKLRRLVS